MKYFLALLALIALHLRAPAVTIDLVPIGNPGNLGELNGGNFFGAVSTAYRIGKTEVTNAQYVEFLNSKAATDTLNLYSISMMNFPDGGILRTGVSGSYSYAVKPDAVGVLPGGGNYTYGDKPVNYVSWFDAVRFANWMNNGQGTGSTETGAYTLLGGTPIPTSPDSISRNGTATWFLPSEDEWYKAAYYNSATHTYFDYPTASDIVPDNHVPSGDTGNSANFFGTATTTNDLDHPFTTAGAYALSDSAYGTFDQGGNVSEWNDTLVTANKRGRRGGAWNTTASFLSSATRDSLATGSDGNGTGFRLAAVAATAGVPGDYNGNGVVDTADYIIWRDHLNTAFQLQNEVSGTSPGMVSQDDYTAWRARFGNVSGSGAGQSQAVPEPTACALGVACGLIFTAIGWLSRRYRDT